MEQEVSDIVLFLGRFHPLILHLPIGFLVMAVILEIASRFKGFARYGAATGFVLGLGAISAALAALLGYLLAQAGGYNEEMLAIHQWTGIGVAVTAGVAWGLKRWQEKHSSLALQRAYLSLLALMMITLAVAGHYGGSLTHGSDYLTEYMPNGLRTIAGLPPKEEKGFKKITNLPEAAVYADIIHPILETRCTSCHNESKKKGELQMHTRQLLLKGGESGPVFVAGNAAESELIRRINLPEHHDDHMPPEGKRPLTDEHKELLAWWVDSGAPFNKKVAELETDEEIQNALQTLVDPQANMTPAEKLLASEIQPAEEQILEQIRARGIDIRAISNQGNWLQAELPRDGSTDTLLSEMEPVSQQLTWLDLANTDVTDGGLAQVGQFPNLTRLHLQNTPVTDAGLQNITGLSNLEYLNLYGTGISDRGIQELKSLNNLRKLFAWQTEVTAAGAKQLKEHLPDLEVNLGVENNRSVTQNTQPAQ